MRSAKAPIQSSASHALDVLRDLESRLPPEVVRTNPGIIPLVKELAGSIEQFKAKEDSTTLQRTQAALNESEERFRSILENSVDAPYRRNLQTDRYDYLSPSIDDQLGWSAQEMISADIQTVLNHIHPEDVGKVEAEIFRTTQECQNTGRSSGQLAYRFRGQDGRYRWIADQITVLAGPDGRPLYRQGFVRDITYQKQIEDTLHQLNRTLRALSAINLAVLHAQNEQDLMQEACNIVVKDCGHKMVWIGFKQDDEGKTVKPEAFAGFEAGYLETLHVTWADTERGQGPTGVSIRTGKPAFCNNMLADPAFNPWREEALRRGYASSIALPMIIDKKVIGSFCIYSDHTDPFSSDEVNLLTELVDDLCYGIEMLRIRAAHASANQALKVSEERYRSLFEAMTEGFALHEIVCDANGKPRDYRFLDINPSFEALTGLTRQEVVGQLKSVLLPDDDPYWLEIYGQVALSGQPVHFENYSSALKRHYEVYAFRPAPMQFAVLFMDITTRKQIEAERERLLKEVEAERIRWKVAFDNTPELVIMTDAQEQLVYMNPISRAAMEKMGALFDRFPTQTGKSHVTLFQSDGKPLDGDDLPVHQAIRYGKAVNNIELIQRTQDGGEQVVLWNAAPILDSNGTLQGTVAVGRDITRLRQAEADLRDTNQRLESVLTSMTQIYYRLDADWRFVEVNTAALDTYFLRPIQDIIGKVIWEELPQAESTELFPQFTTASATKVPAHFEIHSVIRDAWYEVHVYPQNNQLAVYLRDISERMRAEQQINALARFPQENPLPVLRVDASGVILYANSASQPILDTWGCRSGGHVPPDWKELIATTLASNQTESKRVDSGEIQYEIWLAPVQEEGYVNLYGRDITEQEAATAALRQTLTGLEQRVAERTQELQEAFRGLLAEAEVRKQAEESLRQANAYNRGLLEASLDPLVTITPEGKISDVNLATELVTGYSRQELIGTDFADYFTDPIRARSGYQKVFESGKARDYELEIRHKNGSLTQVLYNATVLQDQNGLSAGVFASARDITASKLAQELISLQTSALEAAANGIIITDTSGATQWANRSFTEMTGYSALEITGQNMRLLKSGAHPPSFYRDLWETILRGDVWQGEITNRRKDGRLYIEEQTITPVKDKAGKITHFIAVKQDISQRKEVERARQQQEALLITVLDNLPVGVWLADAEGKLYRSNPAARQLWEGARYVGPSDYGVYRGWHVDSGKEIDEWAATRALRTGETTINEQVEIECFDGSHKFMLNSVIPLVDARQKMYGLVCVNHDITAIRQAQQELQNALAQEQALREHLVQVEKYTAIGRMVASITHELNNPLQSIKNCLYLTRQELATDAPHPFLDMASVEVQRLSVLVSQLREVYRPRSAGQKEPVNLVDLLAQVRVLVNHQLEASSITWEQQSSSRRFLVFGVADQLKQVLLNICLNAIEAMQPNGGSLNIEFRSDLENHQQGILFRDTGPGIPPENLPRLFEPLFTTKQSGMGLGLSISMDIVQKHGGQISVESQLGSGTTFTVWLPLQNVEDEVQKEE